MYATTCDGVIDLTKKYSICGVVQKKYRDYYNQKGQPKIIVNREEFEIHSRYYDSIDVGDSIIKNVGELKHTLIKNNRTIIFYPYCNGDIWYDQEKIK